MSPATRRIATLFTTELRTMLRDRRTVIMSIVLPVVLMPVFLFAQQLMEERRTRALEARAYTYAVDGVLAEEARPLVAAAAVRGEARSARFREARVDDPGAALERGEVDVVVDATEARAVQEAARHERRGPGRPAALVGADEWLATLPPDLPALTVVYRGDRDASESAAARLRERLGEEQRARRLALASDAGFGAEVEAVLAVREENLSGGDEVAGLALGRVATLLLLVFLFTGGAIVAQDTLAGEKERGTLETLLTTAATRVEIVTAKFLLVLAVGVLIAGVQVANLLVYVGFELIPTSAPLATVVTPALAAGLFLFVLPLAALISAMLLLVSGYARSYREAQINFMPMMLACAGLALAAMMPAVPLRSAIVLVPIANISVGVKEVLVGRADWLFLAIAWAVTAGAAGWTMRLAARTLSTERLIVPSTGETYERPGVPALRPERIFTWFAVMWAVLLLVSLNTGPDFDIRLQLLINLGGIFVGGSFLFMRRFRLDWRETLLLRVPRWEVWVAVLVGAPSGIAVGTGVFQLANRIVPVPVEVLESFGQYLVPEGMSFWMLLPFLTLMPGVCEEIAFRGVLQQSLRRFFRPVPAALLVGIIFGLFHVSLFRLFPTAFLGVLFAAVTMLTGSIYPAMVWHALNNGIALVTGYYGWSLAALEPAGYAAATALLALSFWILWRTRPDADPRSPAPGRT
ncbi:MAG: ABC transporter permease subunit [Vicinamibacterales bacterium]|nr:ABC transporter permease subunit [Vicinamibacterales bacterium]